MKKEIKLIALDLDGTTFNSEKVITERTREAIAEAIKKGVIVMPATGRKRPVCRRGLLRFRGCVMR